MEEKSVEEKRNLRRMEDSRKAKPGRIIIHKISVLWSFPLKKPTVVQAKKETGIMTKEHLWPPLCGQEGIYIQKVDMLTYSTSILLLVLPTNWYFRYYLFMKVTIYIRRGVQIIGWSVRIALIACFTQYSGFKGGRKGSISFLKYLIKID